MFPAQTGVLLPAVGVAGTAFTTTVVIAVDVHPAALVTVTVYTPPMPVVEEAIVGFWVPLL